MVLYVKIKLTVLAVFVHRVFLACLKEFSLFIYYFFKALVNFFLSIGKVCNIDMNECESNPCLNNATCVDQIASFSCTCSIGFTGTYCESNINDCEVRI